MNKPEDYIITIEITAGDEDEMSKAVKKDDGSKPARIRRQWGVRRRYSEISYGIATNSICVLENELFPRLLLAENDIKPAEVG